MLEQNNIEKVWYIENNNLVNKNKIVSKINYKGLEIAVLKEDRDYDGQSLLFKDINNEYWDLNLLSFRFNKFLNPSDDIEYCDRYFDYISVIDLKTTFELKISENNYFTKSELAYISKYYPNMYDAALKSREIVINVNKERAEQNERELQLKRKLKVQNTNSQFKKELKELKIKISRGEKIDIKDFNYYKDNNYDNGLTTQNNILYLAKYYGIKIPLATQGFINNRLVEYDFKNKSAYFKETTNKNCSRSMFEYLDKIYELVKKELSKQKER